MGRNAYCSKEKNKKWESIHRLFTPFFGRVQSTTPQRFVEAPEQDLQLDPFIWAVDHVLQYEGGYVNDPKDPGGETKFGISKRAYPDLSIAGLTRLAATEIYRRDYWLRCRCHEMSPQLGFLVFDSAVNHGKSRAIKFLQKSIKVNEDGVIGPNTMKKLSLCPQGLVVSIYVLHRKDYYFQIKSFDRFGRGWIDRLLKVAMICSRMK